MDQENLNKLTTNLISFDSKTFTGAKLNHSIKLCVYLYKNTNSITNMVEISDKILVSNFFKNAGYKHKCITKLKEYGIIESLPGYIVGRKPKGYRLSNDYLPVDKQSGYKMEQLIMGRDFLSKNGINIDEDTFFNTKPGPEGFVLMFGEPENEDIKTNDKQIINFKGIKSIEIDKVSPEDIKLFKEKISALKDMNMEPSESLLQELNLWSKEKTWYIYTKWRNKYGYERTL